MTLAARSDQVDFQIVFLWANSRNSSTKREDGRADLKNRCGGGEVTKVYFATNRQGGAATGFGPDIVGMEPDDVLYAVADVQGTNLTDASSGRIASIGGEAKGSFATAVENEILASNRNLLIFIHGFANSFEDAIKRAAFNADWFRASGIAAADTTVLSFTWPSLGAVIAAPPHFLADDYLADQSQAGKSAFHLAYFLSYIDNFMQTRYRTTNPAGKAFLLAHSMGNYALQGAVQWWFDNRGAGDLIFEEAILAAADEIYDTFERPNGGRLSNLPKLANRITVYSSRKDIAMYLSSAVNLTCRLGFDGPDDKRNGEIYPSAKFRMVDVTEVKDFDPVNPADATHQYYRRSKIVRADIARVMAGEGDGGLLSLP